MSNTYNNSEDFNNNSLEGNTSNNNYQRDEHEIASPINKGAILFDMMLNNTNLGIDFRKVKMLKKIESYVEDWSKINVKSYQKHRRRFNLYSANAKKLQNVYELSKIRLSEARLLIENINNATTDIELKTLDTLIDFNEINDIKQYLENYKKEELREFDSPNKCCYEEKLLNNQINKEIQEWSKLYNDAQNICANHSFVNNLSQKTYKAFKLFFPHDVDEITNDVDMFIEKNYDNANIQLYLDNDLGPEECRLAINLYKIRNHCRLNMAECDRMKFLYKLPPFYRPNFNVKENIINNRNIFLKEIDMWKSHLANTLNNNNFVINNTDLIHRDSNPRKSKLPILNLCKQVNSAKKSFILNKTYHNNVNTNSLSRLIQAPIFKMQRNIEKRYGRK